jgi:hypothetical protein
VGSKGPRGMWVSANPVGKDVVGFTWIQVWASGSLSLRAVQAARILNGFS